jgi:hypothetical protein
MFLAPNDETRRFYRQRRDFFARRIAAKQERLAQETSE